MIMVGLGVGVYRKEGWMDKLGIGIDCNGVIARHRRKVQEPNSFLMHFLRGSQFDAFR